MSLIDHDEPSGDKEVSQSRHEAVVAESLRGDHQNVEIVVADLGDHVIPVVNVG